MTAAMRFASIEGAVSIDILDAAGNRAARSVGVRRRGGELTVVWCQADDQVLVAGPAREVFTGRIGIP